MERIYSAGRKVPQGFKASQLPLARVQYKVGEEWFKEVVVNYDEVKKRFPHELCDKWISMMVLVPPSGIKKQK